MPVLSEARVRAARPANKAYKLYDERGLYLKVETSGSRLWRFKYRYAGKERLLALGAYPDVSLKRAREKRDEARRSLADGISPSARKQEAKAAEAVTFAGVAAEPGRSEPQFRRRPTINGESRAGQSQHFDLES